MVQGLSALYLVRQAPPAGKTVLVNAAAGGVGSLLVQMAKRGGARRLIGAASTEDKLAFVRSLGADAGVNYTLPDWGEALKAASDGVGPDLIYELSGGAVTAESLRFLAPLGRIVIYGALNIQSFEFGIPELLTLIFKNQSVTGFAFEPLLTPERLQVDLRDVFDLVVSGGLKVLIGGKIPSGPRGGRARRFRDRASAGKLVLIP